MSHSSVHPCESGNDDVENGLVRTYFNLTQPVKREVVEPFLSNHPSAGFFAPE